MYRLLLFVLIAFTQVLTAQDVLTPELLWQLGRVSGVGVTDDGRAIFSVSTPDVQGNSFNRKMFAIPLTGGQAVEISSNLLPNKNISPDGKYMLSHKEVKIQKVFGTD